MAVKKRKITYPRHWWFSCNKFTCYVQTDNRNNVTVQSVRVNEANRIKNAIVAKFVGQSGKVFAKWVNKKYGGLQITEFSRDGRAL